MKKFKLLLGLSLAASVIAPLAAISCVNEDTNPPVNGGNKTNNPEENTGSTTNNNPSTSGDSTGSTDTNPNPGTESSGTENPGSSSTGESTGSTTGGETSTPSTDTNPNPSSGSSSTENPGASGESATTSPTPTEETTQSGTKNPTTEGSSSSTEKPTETPTEETKKSTLKDKYDKAKAYADGKLLSSSNANTTLEEVKREIDNPSLDSTQTLEEKLDSLIAEGEKNQTKYTESLITSATYSGSVTTEAGRTNLVKLNEIKEQYKNKKVVSMEEYETKFVEISNLVREIQKAERTTSSDKENTAANNELIKQNKAKLSTKLEELKTANKNNKNTSATKLIEKLEKALKDDSSSTTESSQEGTDSKKITIDFTSTTTVDNFIKAIDKILGQINSSNNSTAAPSEANQS
ncbi:Uncharacterised protein [Mycoplasmopsis meleagridis]|nr:hypothetical protein [Mycoplasmopsis meleagridis]VEU77341.1 Uncharacterised protein [Mycoplasmopsis meleagridis]